MAQENADHLLADSDALQANRPSVPRREGDQARSIGDRVFTGEVAHRQVCGPHRDRIWVIKVFRLRDQDGCHRDAHAAGPGNASEVVLVMRLADDLEVCVAAEDLWSLWPHWRRPPAEPKDVTEYPHRRALTSL